MYTTYVDLLIWLDMSHKRTKYISMYKYNLEIVYDIKKAKFM